MTLIGVHCTKQNSVLAHLVKWRSRLLRGYSWTCGSCNCRLGWAHLATDCRGSNSLWSYQGDRRWQNLGLCSTRLFLQKTNSYNNVYCRLNKWLQQCLTPQLSKLTARGWGAAAESASGSAGATTGCKVAKA